MEIAKITEIIKKPINVIQHQYLCRSTNYAVSLDITKVGNYGEILLAIDFATRAVIAHCFVDRTINTEDVIEMTQKMVQDRSFLPEVRIIHTDGGSVFQSLAYKQVLEARNIEQSIGEGFQNQLSERLNRTIKMRIRAAVNNRIGRQGGEEKKEGKKRDKDVLNRSDLSSQQFGEIIHEVISKYNETKHRTVGHGGVTPNIMEEALFKKHQNKHPEEKILITVNNKSLEAKEIRQYKKIVVDEFKGDWPLFFLNWRKDQERKHQEVMENQKQVIAKLDERAIEAKEREENTKQRYETLFQQHLDLQKKIDFLQQREKKKEKEEEEKQLLRQKKRERQLRKVTETINPDELQQIVGLVKGGEKVIQRKRLALVLLYITGLRVSNLLILEVRHIRELLNDGKTNTRLIKRGGSRFDLVISNNARKLLREFKDDFILLSKEKQDTDLLFTSLNGNKLNRSFFTKELNEVLKRASQLLQKNIRTHSFRATVITDLLKVTTIDKVKELIGHKNIATTLTYNRRNLSSQDMQKIQAKRKLPSIKGVKAKTKGKTFLNKNKKKTLL